MRDRDGDKEINYLRAALREILQESTRRYARPTRIRNIAARGLNYPPLETIRNRLYDAETMRTGLPKLTFFHPPNDRSKR